MATHVDKLFAFVEEVRSKRTVCGESHVRYERQTQLRLPMRKEQEVWDRSLGDAYLEYCGPQEAASLAVVVVWRTRPIAFSGDS